VSARNAFIEAMLGWRAGDPEPTVELRDDA
jgi:hypothetical protein